jgi:hypothetical protein
MCHTDLTPLKKQKQRRLPPLFPFQAINLICQMICINNRDFALLPFRPV